MAIPLLVIVGPTGSGKTEAAILVAGELGGEIVTADSMQVYRGMDIGTAKPTPEEQRGIPHHLLDVADPDEDFSVARYLAEADQAVADIVRRGKTPIVAGGTGFYISALIDRWEFPPRPADPGFRERMQEEARRLGPAALHQRLREMDQASAARIHPNDVKRVIRALEVFHLTGRPLSTFKYRRGEGSPGPYRPLMYGLTMPREVLYRRLEARLRAQVKAGLREEVRRLYQAGYGPELPAMKGINYRQMGRCLRGEYDWEAAVALMARDNRRYAKRQYTWFRADPRVRWLDIIAAGGPAGAAEQIVAGWREFIASAA